MICPKCGFKIDDVRWCGVEADAKDRTRCSACSTVFEVIPTLTETGVGADRLVPVESAD